MNRDNNVRHVTPRHAVTPPCHDPEQLCHSDLSSYDTECKVSMFNCGHCLCNSASASETERSESECQSQRSSWVSETRRGAASSSHPLLNTRGVKIFTKISVMGRRRGRTQIVTLWLRGWGLIMGMGVTHKYTVTTHRYKPRKTHFINTFWGLGSLERS